MIAAILRSGGKTVVYNQEGSNQIEGVTTRCSPMPPSPDGFGRMCCCWNPTNAMRPQL